MISYCGNSGNILVRNIMIFLSSIDIISVSWPWYILHVDIVVTMRWLEACAHKVKEYGWGYISMRKVLDNIKDDLNMIVDQPELILDGSFMMRMMDPWAEEFPPFQEYLDQKLKQQKTNYFNSTSKTKAVPLKELRKEVLYPTDQDNKDITKITEYLGFVAATRWLQQLLEPKKATYPLMYEYGVK